MHKCNVTARFILLVILFLLLPVTSNAEEIEIPLTVHEALRKEVSGIDRTGEHVTVGIPFPEGVLREKDDIPQLSLTGVDDYQFRTLAEWPDGSVKWALVDFQTDLLAGESNNDIKIVRGDGNSSKNYIARNKGDKIIVDTGIMDVEIRKKGFNLFDRVVIKGKEIVKREKSKGIVVTGGAGTEYLGSGSSSKVIIEENGPVRAVIKAEGTHLNGKMRMMDYTVRMYFYKNKSRVKVVYTLRNSSKKQFEHPFIRSLDLVTELSLQRPYEVNIAKHQGTVKDRLSGGNEKIYFYQAVSDFPQEFKGTSFYWHAPIPVDPERTKGSWNKRGFKQEGYWIKKNGEVLSSGQRNEYPDMAFLDISDDEGKGVTVGIRFAAGWWPKSLSANADGTVEVGLWPEENEAGYWIRYGSHNTFEVMYDFHARETDPLESMKKFQYPLVAKAPVEWYQQCVTGIYPLNHFVSFADEEEYMEDHGWDYAANKKNRKARMKVWRYHYWGLGGFINQHDFARIALVNFLRATKDFKKSGEYFLYADARFNYNADWAIFHSDDYHLKKINRKISPSRNRKRVQLAKVVFEDEHMHWYGLPLYYYLTGDERIKEAVLDLGEVIKSKANKKWITVYQRYFGWEMYSLAAMYDFTKDPSFMKLADQIFSRLLTLKFNRKKPVRNIYIDWNRGFVTRNRRVKPGLMTGYIIFDGLYNYYLNMDDNNSLKERVADVLEGISDFMYREPYVEGIKKSHKGEHRAFWLPYIYHVDDKSKSKQGYRLILQAFYSNLAPYSLNGESKWLERMDKIIRSAAWDRGGMWEGFTYLDHPGLQSILYNRIHPRKDSNPPFPISDLSAVAKGKKVILKWTVPADAMRYQIKFSNKKLVESLEFDPDIRSYKHDPEEYANWWAGENIINEPEPAEAGTHQRYSLKGLKPGRYYFAIRSWDASNNRSGISNLVEVITQ